MAEELSADSAVKRRCFMLLVERGERQWLFPIDRDPIAIGRSVNNHVSIDDSQLAPRHLRIIPLGEEIWAKDMGSPAGFQVNGRWLREALLRSGDEIAVGEVRASVLVEERAVPPAPLAPMHMPEAPEPPPTPVRRRHHVPSPPRRGVPAWLIVSSVVSSVLLLGVFWMQRSAWQETEKRRQESQNFIDRARNYLGEKQPGKAREALRGISYSDPEIAAQKQGLEKDIVAQETEARRLTGREEGDEYYERYLLPLYKSNEILSDIRWETVAWRRSEDFLARYPKHPLTSVVQARRDRFAAGAKEAPRTRIEELEIDVRQLMQAKLPNLAMARKRTLAFIGDNLGGEDDLRARDLLKQVDARSEAHLAKAMAEARDLWNSGKREQAVTLLDRLIEEIGREDLAEQAREAKSKLQGG